MPIITYHPEDADPQTFDFEFRDLKYPVCVTIEKLTGRDFQHIPAAFMAGNYEVRGAVLFALLKAEEPDLRPEQFLDNLRPSADVDVDMNVAEAERILEALTRMPPETLTDEQRAVIDVLADKVRGTVLAGVDGDDEAPEAPKA